MINHSIKFVFVHINKTAGTSIEKSLPGCVRRRNVHPSANEYKQMLGENFKNYFKFSFVRNPWDKMKSFYLFRSRSRKQWMKQHNYGRLPTFEEFIKNMLDIPTEPYGSKITHTQRASNQLDWLTDENENILVDFIGRYETLQSDYEKVCNELKLPSALLPEVNCSGGTHYSEYYTSETQEIVATRFQRDIDFFNYNFE